MLDFEEIISTLKSELKSEFKFNDNQTNDVILLLNDCGVDLENVVKERYPEAYQELLSKQAQEESEEEKENMCFFGTKKDVIGL